ncbi:MAG: SDR family oxidoreductase [Lewinellaceae bacterium]|nr:SDR family oxidoreductase [Lewinellaceae bacterium]
MILVIGATGILGNEICQLLAAEGKETRAMARLTSDKMKVRKLEQMGITIATGDLREPDSTGPALKKIDTVITTVSSMPFSYVPGDNDIQHVDLNGMKALIDNAKAAGVRHFIYTSFSKQIDEDIPLRNAKRAIEQYLRQSGMAYTILRPSCFMEVWLTPAVGFDAENGKVQVFGDGRKPVSYISYKDVAKFAVRSIENPAARNAILELGGPEMLSQLDAVKIFEEIEGRKFEINHVPVEALRKQMNAATDPMQKSFSGLMLSVAKGDPIDMKEVLRDFPVRLASVRDFARSTAAIA